VPDYRLSAAGRPQLFALSPARRAVLSESDARHGLPTSVLRNRAAICCGARAEIPSAARFISCGA